MAAFDCKEWRVNVRQIAGGLAVAAALITAPMSVAQKNTNQSNASAAPATEAASNAHWNFGALVQSGFGVTEERGGFKFLLIGGHAGRILTPNLGPGLIKGNFEYGVEVFPLWQSYTPKFQRSKCTQIFPPGVPSGTYVSCTAEYTVGGTFTGVSITPAIFRWNFTHGERWMPWIQGAGGVIWTNHKYPAFGEPLPAPGPITIGPPAGQYYLDNDGPSCEHQRLELHAAVRRRYSLFCPPATFH